jgi:hypothetical protein
MERKCIVCGKALGDDEFCHGRIKGMEVTVCRDHMNQCYRCDTKYCESGA